MQGWDDGKSSMRARIATAMRGTTETRILKRNMIRIRFCHKRRVFAGSYGLRSVNKTRYRLVDRVKLRHLPDVFGQRPVGQGFGEVKATDLFGAVEIGERAGDAQHAMIAARRKAHGLGGVAQELLALRVRPRDLFQKRGRRLRIWANSRQARRAI